MSNPPPPSDDRNPNQPLPVIFPDADPHNANWLRILAQRRKQRKPTPQPTPQKETLTDGDVQ